MNKHNYLFISVLLLMVNIANAQNDLFITQEIRRPALYDTGCVYMSSFPEFKPDLIRLCNIVIFNPATLSANSTWLAASSQHLFVAEDLGKILVVKNARSYPEYRKAPFTLNAKIESITPNGEAVIVSYDNAGTIIPVNGACGFLATDNFDVMQKAIDTCAAKNKKKLRINFSETAYLVPQLSARSMPSAAAKNLVVSNNLEIIGLDSMVTKLKWGMEDISRVDDATVTNFKAFWIKNCSFKIKRISLLSPDRTSTNLDNQAVEAIYGDSENRLGQNVIVDSAAIISEDADGFEGWGNAIYMNGSQTINTTDTALQQVKYSNIRSQGGLAFFSRAVGTNDPFDKQNHLQRVQYSNVKGGAKDIRKATGAEINLGSNILIMHNPEFSFYDFTNYDSRTSNIRQPFICIARPTYNSSLQGDTTTVYWTQVQQILNDSMAVIDTAARPGAFFHPKGTINCNTNSNIVFGDAQSLFLDDLFPGDKLFANTFGTPLLGIVDSILSQNQLRLVSNATITGNLIESSCPTTSLFIPSPAYTFYNPQLRRHGVRWATNNGTLYSLREGGNYAAFHSLYISGNVGSNNISSQFEPLRQSRRAADVCFSPLNLCGSCLNYDNNLVFYDNTTWYPAGADLKKILFGPGNGIILSSATNYEAAAPQKN
jgi:hypothetical protein